MSIYPKRGQGVVPPPPTIEHFELWCCSRGEVDKVNHVYTGDRAVWKRARREWLAEHGWPGGEPEMLAGEEEADDEEDFGLAVATWGCVESAAHSGGPVVCAEHGLTEGEH